MTDPNQNKPRALKDVELDSLFSAAKAETPEPDLDFMAQLVADAHEAQPRPATVTDIAVRPGLGQRILAVFGGWPAMAGLAATGCFGVLLGISSPDILTLLTDGVLSSDVYLSDYLPGVDGVLIDG